MKKILEKGALKCATLALILTASLSSCDKDDDKIPSNLYQEYEVLVERGSVSAFANIRRGGASGERVNVGDRLSVNTQVMFFEEPLSATEPEFTYFVSLAPNHQKAIFHFRNSAGKVLVNTSDFSNMESVVPLNSALYEVSSGEQIEIALHGAPVSEVKAYLVGTSALSTPMELTLMSGPDLSAAKASVRLPEVIGIYDLVLDRVVVEPITQGDGTASGEIKTVIRSRSPLKISGSGSS